MKPIQSESYVGLEFLKEITEQHLMKNVLNVKHPATIIEYTQPSSFKMIERDTPLFPVGLDVETDESGDLRLLGVHSGDRYSHLNGNGRTPQEMMDWLCECVSTTYMNFGKDNACFVSWRELDGLVIFKTLLQAKGWNPDEALEHMKRWGHVEGEWTGGEWVLEPLVRIPCEIKKKPMRIKNEEGEWVTVTQGKKIEFGILQAIQGSICFFMLPEGANKLQKIWLYDLSAILSGSLQDNAKEFELDYEKAPEKYHLIDWEEFKTNADYRREVLKSNRDDSLVVHQLANCVSHHYSETFKKSIPDGLKGWQEVRKYPSGFWSSGSLCVFALSMSMKEKDRKSINWMYQMDDWGNKQKHTPEELKEVYLQSIESFKAGLFEAFRIGNGKGKKIFKSDISAAYPFIMMNLYDLRGSTIKTGKGEPPKPNETSYVIARATAKEVGIDTFHSIGVKEPRYEEATVRLCGEFTATAIYQEWEQLEKTGAEIEWIDWVEIQTTGEPHPLSKVIQKLWKKRMNLEKLYKETGLKKYKSQANAVKLVMNSIYGKMFEGVKKFSEINITTPSGVNKDVLMLKGFKAGQLFSPLLATLVTGFTRIRMVEILQRLKEKGSKPILAMADSIFWEGEADHLPKADEFDSILGDYGTGLRLNGWTEEKAIGAWEKPVQCLEFMCLGIGRYQYKTEDGDAFMKVRGMTLNVIGYSMEGTQTEPIYETIEDMMEKSIEQNIRKKDAPSKGEPCLIAKQRILATPQYCVHEMRPELLGTIQNEEVEMIVTRVFPKREARVDQLNHKTLVEKLVDTWNPDKDSYTETTRGHIDGSLPHLRNKMDEMELIVFETEAIKKQREKEVKQQSNQKRALELKALSKFFGMSQDALKKWRSSLTNKEQNINGMDIIRKEATDKGFKLEEWI